LLAGAGRLNFHASSNFVKDKLREMKPEEGENPRIDYDEFVLFVRMLRVRTEFRDLFNKYSKDKERLKAEELLRFLQQEQREQDVRTLLTIGVARTRDGGDDCVAAFAGVQVTLDACGEIVRKYRRKNAEIDRLEKERQDMKREMQRRLAEARTLSFFRLSFCRRLIRGANAVEECAGAVGARRRAGGSGTIAIDVIGLARDFFLCLCLW
jgi:hypothetical protein